MLGNQAIYDTNCKNQPHLRIFKILILLLLLSLFLTAHGLFIAVYRLSLVEVHRGSSLVVV